MYQSARSNVHALFTTFVRPAARRSATSSRHIGSSGSKRRRVGASDIFTACYTSIMASAAVLDASYKDKRRQDLDQRLDEARQDLARALQGSSPEDPTAVDTDTDTVAVPGGKTRSPYKVVQGISSICVSPSRLLQDEMEMDDRHVYLSWIHGQFGLPRRWWTQRPDAKGGLDEIEAALDVEERALADELLGGRGGEREPKTPTQFAKMIEATNLLVDDLLEAANEICSPGDEEAQRINRGRLESPWWSIKMMRNEGYPIYRLPDLDPEGAARTRQSINGATRQIFGEWEEARAEGPRPSLILRRQPQPDWYQRQVALWVGKLCFNLTVASTPFSMNNLNVMLLGFTRAGEHLLAELVIDFILLDSRLRPTQLTLVLILQHYRAKGDLVGFYGILRRMVALDNRGVKLRRRRLGDFRENPYLKRWAKENDVAIVDNFAVERARIDEAVFDAILAGLLSLGQVRHAVVVFASYLSDCYKIKAEVLNRIANCILDVVDVPAARAFLQGLVKNASLVTPLLMSEERYARKLAIKIHLLVSVVLGPRLPWNAEKQRPNLAVMAVDLGNTAENCERIAKALFVSDTLQYLMRLDQIVLAAKGAAVTDTTEFAASAASWSIQFTSLRNRQQRLDRERALYRRMSQLKAIDEAFGAVFDAIAYVMESFLELVAGSMDVPAIYKAFLQQSYVPFKVRFASYLAVRPQVEAEAQAETEAPVQNALVERLVLVDGPAASGFLENRLKRILLKPLSAAELEAAGISAQPKDTKLDTVLSARAVYDQARIAAGADIVLEPEAPPPPPPPETKKRSVFDFISRLGLFSIFSRS